MVSPSRPCRDTVGLQFFDDCALYLTVYATASVQALLVSVALLSVPPIAAQTFSVGVDGRLVEQAALVSGNQTTIFFDSTGRPIPPKDKGLTSDVGEASIAAKKSPRSPGKYSKRHAQVIQNIHMVARRYQGDPVLRRVNLNARQWSAFFQAMIRIESNYKPTAHSHANAIGLAQIIPSTARYLRIDVHDPIQNLDGGARYLLEQMQTFGDIRLALAAYNAGPGAVQKYGGIPPYKETQNHVRRVMAEYARLLS